MLTLTSNAAEAVKTDATVVGDRVQSSLASKTRRSTWGAAASERPDRRRGGLPAADFV